jgi:cysteinyl-tRNA synthetase
MPDLSLSQALDRCRVAFKAAMDDDLNTPVAIAALQGLRSEVNKLTEKGLASEGRRQVRQEFRSLGNVLGLFQLDQWQFNSAFPSQSEHAPVAGQASSMPTLSDKEVENRIVERTEAKRRKDFKRADEIREELRSLGITIEDKPDGTSRWKR